MDKKSFFIIFYILANLFFLSGIELLSDGYKDIKLGMNKDQVMKIINSSPDFNPLKEELLTVRLEPDTEIITTEGLGFIELAYFHFHNEQLFQILFKISEEKIGYYTLLKSLTAKFGNPKKLNPKKAFWENDRTKIIIEKPCTLKYQFLPVWNTLITKDNSTDTINKIIRDEFLKDL
ncbi:MAG: hypothetical protein JXB50_11770 [Spirochaetes bacterium]|nr:hypothetical protein [Spirochaetota bacterium]